MEVKTFKDHHATTRVKQELSKPLVLHYYSLLYTDDFPFVFVAGPVKMGAVTFLL